MLQLPQLQCKKISYLHYVWEGPDQQLHAARRYFHDDNGLQNLEALKNIYQAVTH